MNILLDLLHSLAPVASCIATRLHLNLHAYQYHHGSSHPSSCTPRAFLSISGFIKVLLSVLSFLLVVAYQSCYAKNNLPNRGPFSLYGGFDMQYGYVQEQPEFHNRSDHALTADTNIHLLYLFKMSENTTFGSAFCFKALYHSRYTGSSTYHHDSLDNGIADIHDQGAYVFFKSKRNGILEFGLADSVDKVLKISGSGIAVASGGVGGDWTNYANLRSENNAQYGAGYNPKDVKDMFWVKPRLYNHYRGLKSPLFSYYSAPFQGLKMGFTYVPGKNNNGYIDLVTTAVNYSDTFATVDYSLAFVNEYASGDPQNNLNDIHSFSAGASIKYKNLRSAISYGRLGRSGHIAKAANLAILDTNYVDFGVSYCVNNWKTSTTYFYSNRKNSQGNHGVSAWALGWENAFYKRTSYYMDLIYFSTKISEKDGNSGYVFLTGLKFGF